MTDPNAPAPQPYSQPAPAAPAGGPAPSPGDYPGKTLGIVGLILVFFTAVIGLIVSAIALNQSKKAGYQNTPAKVGVVLGIIFTVLAVLVVILYFAIFAAALAVDPYSY